MRAGSYTMILGLCGAVSVDAAAQQGPATEAALVIEASAAGEAGGAERIGELRVGRVSRARGRGVAVRLEAGRCYRLAAQGSAEIPDLDVAFVRGRAVLARDTATGSSAQVVYCAGERPERVVARVSALRGGGPYAAGVFRLPAGVTREAAAAPLLEEGALERLAELVRRHGADMTPVTAPAREELPTGERVERPLRLAPGRCYRVLAAGESSVEDLDLELRGPTGEVLDRDASDDAQPTLGVLRPLCPAAHGEHTLVHRMERGAGAFAVQVLGSGGAASTARPPPSRYRVGGAGSGFLPERIRRRHREAGGGRPAVTDLAIAGLRTGERRAVSVPVLGGHCYVALAAGVPSVRALELRVLDPHGNERAAASGQGAEPAASFCASVGGSWRVEVRAFAGYGHNAVQVFGGPR